MDREFISLSAILKHDTVDFRLLLIILFLRVFQIKLYRVSIYTNYYFKRSFEGTDGAPDCWQGLSCVGNIYILYFFVEFVDLTIIC